MGRRKKATNRQPGYLVFKTCVGTHGTRVGIYALSAYIEYVILCQGSGRAAQTETDGGRRSFICLTAPRGNIRHCSIAPLHGSRQHQQCLPGATAPPQNTGSRCGWSCSRASCHLIRVGRRGGRPTRVIDAGTGGRAGSRSGPESRKTKRIMCFVSHATLNALGPRKFCNKSRRSGNCEPHFSGY